MVDDKARIDPLCGDVCAVVSARRTERVQGVVVYLRIPLPHIVFVYYPHQVCHFSRFRRSVVTL